MPHLQGNLEWSPSWTRWRLFSVAAVKTLCACSSWGLSEGQPKSAKTDLVVLPSYLVLSLAWSAWLPQARLQAFLFTFLSVPDFAAWTSTRLLTSTFAFAATESRGSYYKNLENKFRKHAEWPLISLHLLTAWGVYRVLFCVILPSGECTGSTCTHGI